MFKSRDDESIFMTVDMPLYEAQCNKVLELLENVPEVIGASHDHYGSFVFFLDDDVEQNEDLFEKIYASLEDFYTELHNVGEGWWHYYTEVGADNCTIEEIHESVKYSHEYCGYVFDLSDIEEIVVDVFGQEAYDEYAVEQKLVTA